MKPPERVLRDWSVFTPEGFYNASAEASLFIRWKLGDELLPATKNEEIFHRPDLVQQSLKSQ